MSGAALRILLAFLAFIAVGMPDTLLGVAWPTFRVTLDVDFDALGLIVLAGTLGYTSSALVAGRILRTLGLGLTLVLSTLLTVLGTLSFAFVESYFVVVALAFMAGTGGGAIDVGLNQYVIEYHSDGLMHWLHAAFGVGVTISPAIMGLAIELAGYRSGYLVMTGVLLLLMLTFLASLKLWPKVNVPEESQASGTLDFRLVLAIGMFVLYCGCELAVGVMAYSLFVEGRGIDPLVAAGWVSLYWGSFTASRVITGGIANRFSHWQVVNASLAISMLGAVVLLGQPMGGFEWLAMALLGFGFGPIYPALMTGTADRAGEYQRDLAISFQVGFAALGAGGLTVAIGYAVTFLGTEAIGWSVLALLMVVTAGSTRQAAYQLSTR